MGVVDEGTRAPDKAVDDGAEDGCPLAEHVGSGADL
jgi:hypothetical protein